MPKLTLGANLIDQVCEHGVLGVTLNEELLLQSHIDIVCKKLPQNSFLFGQLKHDASSDCRKMFFKAYLLVHIHYASSFWSNTSELHLKKTELSLQKSSKANFT